MIYAVASDFILAFEQQEVIHLTNMENPNAVSVDMNRLNQALDNASFTIDLYLGLYTFPITTVPEWFNQCCLDIARFNLYQGSVPDEVVLKHDAWIKRLELIAKGLIKLAGMSLSTPVVTTSSYIRVRKGDRVYSDTFKDF